MKLNFGFLNRFMPAWQNNGEPSKKAPSANTPSKAVIAERRSVPGDKVLYSVAALLAWTLLFAAGLLIDTLNHRYVLAPDAIRKQLQPEDQARVEAEVLNDVKTYNWSRSFWVSIFCYTPLNLAILTLTAGFLGGCASNISIQTMPELRAHHPSHRTLYMQEPPISAAIRGFLVYLCVIGGLYLAMDDPFKNPTSNQYIRLAGTLSVMAFVVGYDPSRLQDWLGLIPRPHPAQHDEKTPKSKKRGKKAKQNGDIPETVGQAQLKAENLEAQEDLGGEKQPSTK